MRKSIMPFFFMLLLILGCGHKGVAEGPDDYIKNSDIYYKKAVSFYKSQIASENDKSSAYLKLGKLYLSRGEYELAVSVLRNSSAPEARKFLALSFYRMGSFTDALEIFNREAALDNESRYYFGLTCERLNLFSQAVKVYEEIDRGEFKDKANLRLEEIQRKSGITDIKKADSRIAKILKNAPNPKLYPQAGALVLLAEEEIEITEKDTQESTLHYLVKILNERGKEKFAESAIEYDSTFEKIELVYARTIKPDGKVVYVGSRHIRDLSKYLNFPLYSNAHVFIISFPEVSNGSTIEYKVKIKRSRLVNKKDFFLSYPVKSYEPIISADFKLILPRSKGLKIKNINSKYGSSSAYFNPVKDEKQKSVVYRWHLKNIPQIIAEPNMPEDVEINPTILFSTFNDWRSVYDWWWGLARGKIKADSLIKEEVRRLIKGKAKELDKARAIYNFCAKNIRHVAVEYGEAGYEPHQAGEILRNKYGDCKDQAILLVTMLREAGFKASPVLIGTKQYYNLNQDFPSALFNHCIAAVYLDGSIIFLDPTAETCSFGDLPPGDQGRRVLVFDDNSYSIRETPIYSAEHNLIRQELKLKVNDNESIFGRKVNITRGAYDQRQRYWLLYTQPELIQDAITTMIQEVSIGAKLIDYKIDNLNDLSSPVILSYDFSGPEYFTRAGKLRIMPQLANIDTSFVAKEKRNYPIDFILQDKRELYLEITLPDNFVIQYIPASIKRESPWFNFEQEYLYKNGRLYFKQSSRSKRVRIEMEEYNDFKIFMEDLARSVKQRVVLEKVK